MSIPASCSVLVLLSPQSEIIDSPVLESFRQRYVHLHQQFHETVLGQTWIFFLKKVDQMCFIRENAG
jgi:hypothetical protein